MNFNEFKIDESDYGFFVSLPKDEKLLFIYDLICERAYGTGSTELLSSEPFTPIEIDIIETDSELDISTQNEKFRSYIESSINKNIDVNIFILNDKVILNSDFEEKLQDSINNMLLDGIILYKQRLSEKARYIFQHQKCCSVYVMVGKTLPVSKN